MTNKEIMTRADENGNLINWYFDCGYNLKMESELKASAKLINMRDF